jgi:prepilin-type processing-associated H-X9-DG protein
VEEPTSLASHASGAWNYNSTAIRYRINYTGFTLNYLDGFGYAAHDLPPEFFAALTNANIPLMSNHPGGAHALMTDGSVHFLQEAMELDTLHKLANRQDGVPIGSL